MRAANRFQSKSAWVAAMALIFAASGCHSTQLASQQNPSRISTVPRELSKVSLPQYRIEPPDLLTIDAVHIVPKSPYALRTLDVLGIDVQRSAADRLQGGDLVSISVPGALVEAPIDGVYQVEPNGLVNLGGIYGSVSVERMPVGEAELAIEEHLRKILNDPETTVSLQQMGSPISGAYPIQVGGVVNLGPYGNVPVQSLTVAQAQAAIAQALSKYFIQPKVSVSLISIGAQQQIAGEHLVGPDGTVNLGSYGSVSVVGMSINEAKIAIEQHLSRYLDRPEVAVNVFSFNSKVYYIITQGAGMGDRVYRFPVTGNETVLDAMAQINGLEGVSSKQMWIARPTSDPCKVQLLPVDWDAITAQASTETNYQLMPNDRLFIAEDQLVAFDTALAKMIAPLERIMGFATLGAGTATRLSGSVLKGGGNSRSTF